MGATTIVLDRDQAGAEETVRLAAELPGKAVIRCIDLAKTEEIDSCVDGIAAEFGRIDVLVNSAALNFAGPALEMREEIWDRVIDVNLSGVFFAARAAARHMMAHRTGRIVNVASIGGLSAGITGKNKPNASYRASKGGVVNLTRALAIEWAPHIRVNAVAPGYVHTPMVAVLSNDPVRRKAVEDLVPMGRIADPADIAWPIAFLTSSASSMITGQILTVDGGLLA